MNESFDGEQDQASRIFAAMRRLVFVVALGLLLTYFVLVGSAFSIAFFDRARPDFGGGNDGGNHGPWRHYQPVRSLMNIGTMAALSSLPVFLSAACLGERRAFWVGAFALVTIFFDFIFLTWLVD